MEKKRKDNQMNEEIHKRHKHNVHFNIYTMIHCT